ncbi:MAG: hypothetical protein IKV13_01315, partial [Akkermansia sp.]|nr:hypothetical protein [Akkermansia sp.]
KKKKKKTSSLMVILMHMMSSGNHKKICHQKGTLHQMNHSKTQTMIKAPKPEQNATADSRLGRLPGYPA